MNKEKIKVALIGNIANNFFREAQSLQSSSKIVCHLYAVVNQFTPNTELPESDKPELKGNYPQWIKLMESIPVKHLILLSLGLGWIRSRKELKYIKILSQYDLCVFSGPEVVLLPWVKTKTIFRVTGSDITVFPTLTYSEFKIIRSLPRVGNLMDNFRSKLNYYLNQRLYRIAVRKASFISAPITALPYKHALNRLKRYDFIEDIFRLAVDMDVFKRNENSAEYSFKRWGIQELNFNIFVPSRMMLRNTEIHKITGQWKASEKIFYALQLFLNELIPQQRSRVKLIIPDRTASDDLDAAKELANQLNLNDNIIYVKGDNISGLTRSEMLNIYSVSQVVLDDFGAGWYGSVSVEALSCSCPVITFVPDNLMFESFSWHPFLVAFTPDEIASHLRFLFDNPEETKRLGAQGWQWVSEFHSEQAVRERLESRIAEIVK
ncbi:MAG: glycosyltransferase [Anaerolineales bacterium]|uniref:glycosyltransferase n=1 Tax=Candidatus Villigracilis vicinus TaxID=3140679 RepID=UPI003137411B|nr:glycosyltransferase [Anaerolineales bacterium]